jgi:hypothetical protein
LKRGAEGRASLAPKTASQEGGARCACGGERGAAEKQRCDCGAAASPQGVFQSMCAGGARLHALQRHCGDFFGELEHQVRVNTKTGFASKRLAADFQHHAAPAAPGRRRRRVAGAAWARHGDA